jgi:ABC-type nitrate/sulfonate/bicarbonate transport system substrate-binding protein
MAPLWMAKESGAFERAGVPVEVVLIQASAAVAALIAGEVDFLQLSAPPVVTAGIQDADIVFIAGALNNMIHSVHVQSDIRSAEGLKGKLFGSDRPGTPNDFATVRGMEKLGLQPSDVQVLAIGSSEQLLAALLSGQLAGTVIAPPQSFAAEDAGYPELINLYDVAYQTIGIAGLRSKLPALEPAIIPFLRAYRAGMERYDTDKAFAMKVLDDYGKIGDPSILERTYDFYKSRGWNRSLTVSEAGVQNVIDLIAKTVPAAQGVSAEQFIERRYVQQLGPN